MGKRGPAPTPTKLKLVRGTRKDRINRSEPIPTEGDIRPPAWLAGEAVEVWAEYAPDLVAKKVLTAWDVEAFAIVCDAAARRREAARELEKHGLLVESVVYDRSGNQVTTRVERNPAWQAWREAGEQVFRFGARFGLTPSDRSQLKLDAGAGAKSAGDSKQGERLLS